MKRFLAVLAALSLSLSAMADISVSLPGSAASGAFSVTGTAGLVALGAARQGTMALRTDTTPWSCWILAGGSNPAVIANWRQFATFDENGDLIMNIIPRSGLAADLALELWPTGTMCWATDAKRLIVHDGVTVGGIPQALASTAAASELIITMTGTPSVPWAPMVVLPAQNVDYSPGYTGTHAVTAYPGPWITSGTFQDNGPNPGVTELSSNLVGTTSSLFTSTSVMPALQSVTLPDYVYSGTFLLGGTLKSLTTVTAPLYIYSGGTGVLIANVPALTILTLPAFRFAQSNIIGSGAVVTALTTVSLPVLEYCGSTLFNGLVTYPALTTVLCPSLEYVATGILDGCVAPNLTTIDFSSLKYSSNNCTFPAAKLDQASIDGILTVFANMDGTDGTRRYGTGLTFTCSGGTNAAPTFTGTSKTSTTIVTSTPTDSYRVTGTCVPDNFGVYTYTGTLNGQNVYRSEFNDYDLWYNSGTSKWTISPASGTAGVVSWTATGVTGTYAATGAAVTGTPAVAVHSKATVAMVGHGFGASGLVTVTGAAPAALNGTYAFTSSDTDTFYYFTATSTNAATQGSFMWTSSPTEGFYQKQKMKRRGATVNTN